MAKISKGGKGKTLYIELSIYPCGVADPTKNLTISCPDSDTRFKTTFSDDGLQKFKKNVLKLYSKHIIDEIVALLLCYCLSSLYRLTYPEKHISALAILSS